MNHHPHLRWYVAPRAISFGTAPRKGTRGNPLLSPAEANSNTASSTIAVVQGRTPYLARHKEAAYISPRCGQAVYSTVPGTS